MKFSLVPLLFALQILAILIATRSAVKKNRLGNSGWIIFMVLLLVAWSAVTVGVALSGIYVSKPFLAAYPTLWLPFIPVVLVLTVLMLSSGAREAVRNLIDATPDRWLIRIHALRILALGTLIKAWTGTFVMSFALLVGIPDLLFGLSALLISKRVADGRIGKTGLAVWHSLGVLAIIPGAPIVAQMGLPGIFHTFTETPSMITLYAFPMVIAPSLVVPIFVMMNMLVAIRLVERLLSKNTSSTKEPDNAPATEIQA